MANIIDVIRRYFRPYYYYILFTVMFIIFLSVGVFWYNRQKSQTQNRFKDVANQNRRNHETPMYFFFADWCPHCKTAKPIWNELKDEYQNKTINGYSVVFTEVNCTTETPEVEKLMNQYKVEGFPTIKLLKDGQVIEYDAKPTKETLNQFLNTVL
jgi:thiol-disulfide isomerase/thioredoxin